MKYKIILLVSIFCYMRICFAQINRNSNTYIRRRTLTHRSMAQCSVRYPQSRFQIKRQSSSRDHFDRWMSWGTSQTCLLSKWLWIQETNRMTTCAVVTFTSLVASTQLAYMLPLPYALHFRFVCFCRMKPRAASWCVVCLLSEVSHEKERNTKIYPSAYHEFELLLIPTEKYFKIF